MKTGALTIAILALGLAACDDAERDNREDNEATVENTGEDTLESLENAAEDVGNTVENTAADVADEAEKATQ